jgi:hypothetical protein
LRRFDSLLGPRFSFPKAAQQPRLARGHAFRAF